MAADAKKERKSYAQYCVVARTLDLVGERWTLLIVRDLLMGPKRYTDLRASLPGIATDILTARLRTLEEAGFVRRRQLPRPAPATVYELTAEGLELRRVILALGRVGMSRLEGGPAPGEDVQVERLVLALRVSFQGDRFADVSETYGLTIDGESFTVEVIDGVVTTSPGAAASAAPQIRTDVDTFIALLTGELTAAAALDDGRAEIEGDRAALGRFVDAFAWRPVAP